MGNGLWLAYQARENVWVWINKTSPSVLESKTQTVILNLRFTKSTFTLNSSITSEIVVSLISVQPVVFSMPCPIYTASLRKTKIC